MTSPQALFLSLAATVCAFALVLVVIASQVSSAATPVMSATQAPSTVAVVAQEIDPRRPARLCGRPRARRPPLKPPRLSRASSLSAAPVLFRDVRVRTGGWAYFVPRTAQTCPRNGIDPSSAIGSMARS